VNAASFALYDTLCCCATAVDEAESEQAARAETAWLEACMAAIGLFPAGSAADAAVGVLLAACQPASSRRPGHAALWNALDAASCAVLPAMAGDADCTRMLLPGAYAAAAVTAPDLRAALTVILAEIEAMAGAGMEAAA